MGWDVGRLRGGVIGGEHTHVPEKTLETHDFWKTWFYKKKNRGHRKPLPDARDDLRLIDDGIGEARGPKPGLGVFFGFRRPVTRSVGC